MPVYIPSFAPMAPEVGLNQPPTSAVAGIAGGAALSSLSAGVAEGIIARDTINDLAAVLDKTSPEIAEILRAQSSSVPLFGTRSGGAGTSARGGGGGVGGSGLDAVSFALRSIQSAQEHQQRVALEELQHLNSLGYVDAQFSKSASLKGLDLTYGLIEEGARQENKKEILDIEAQMARDARLGALVLAREYNKGKEITADAMRDQRGGDSVEGAADALEILNNSRVPANFRRMIAESIVLGDENGGFNRDDVAEMPDGEIYNRATGMLEGLKSSPGGAPYRPGSTIEGYRRKGQE